MVLEAVNHALKRAEQLKKQLQDVGDLLVDGTVWDAQQKIAELYQQVLLLDLEFALDQKAEQDLWNYGHKNFISSLQAQAKNKDNPKRSEAQSMLNWFLDSASGFYLSMLGEICSQFNLDLPFRRKDSTFGLSWPEKKYPPVEPQKSSCLYFCQHCLVHLGDIARYRVHLKQAETYYKHAVTLSPTSGQPYNQLALLAASKGDQLCTVFHYVRSVAVRHPFTAAGINLDKTLLRCSTARVHVEGKHCLTGPEFVMLFLKFHGLLKCHGNIDQAKPLVSTLGQTLTALVATQNFSGWKLVQMLLINIHMHQEAHEQQKEVILDLVVTFLCACLLPVYTLTKEDSLLGYVALPSVKLTLEWIALNPLLLNSQGLVEKKQIWPSLCNLLNSIVKIKDGEEKSVAVSNDPDLPLPEDRDVQGFLPLQPFLSSLKFNSVSGEEINFNIIRAVRLLKLGKALANTSTGENFLALDDTGTFIAFGQPQLEPSDIIKKLEELNVAQEAQPDALSMNHGSSATSPVPSDGSSWETGKSTPDSSGGSGSIHGIIDMPSVKPEEDLWRPRLLEKENIEEHRRPLPGRMNQNVALQAIFRVKEQEKQPLTNGNGHYDGWKSPIGFNSPENNSLFGNGMDSGPCFQQNAQEFNMWDPKPVEQSIWGNTPTKSFSSPGLQNEFGHQQVCKEVPQEIGGYSLFSSTPAWCITSGQKNQSAAAQMNWKAPEPVLHQPPLQSLWPGSSALERLLEQQKQQREGGT
ncbi:nonsense-mediated mRNA decay factor SMG7-like [Neocloeon triangulifer]|uniref:nonsense-mediated mRNA decay factor SMG7-like n=1 Tax=Neocloeon triangulifer TaxID=2078957 RepID=UPI00286F9511|nr:nonsense-mediated mRNA decay factor SMG7-like [Neocloeon triangulifer]